MARARRADLTCALIAAAAVVLSAPYSQQWFTGIRSMWPDEADVLSSAATILPASLVLMFAAWRIRDRRLPRYALLAIALAIGLAAARIGDLLVAEEFHFIEYGVIAIFFYRTWHEAGDLSIVALPLLAGVIVGSLDEIFQWFIPIRAGEARDVGLDLVATLCGVCLAAAMWPPMTVTRGIPTSSRGRVWQMLAGAVVAFAAFFVAVHVGHMVDDPDVGLFYSRYTAGELARAEAARAVEWRTDPPLELHRLSREDQYLSEGLWRVRRRNQELDSGHADTAWHENRILEKYYAPVLDTSTYVTPAPSRWSTQQRDDVQSRSSNGSVRYESREYAYPLYLLPSFMDAR